MKIRITLFLLTFNLVSAQKKMHYSEKKLLMIHNYMKSILKIKHRAIIDDIFYSPYYKFSKKRKYRLNKKDRKPNIGLFIKAIEKWNIDINKSFFLGDSETDKKASEKLNLKFYYKNKGSLYRFINSEYALGSPVLSALLINSKSLFPLLVNSLLMTNCLLVF